ncbi:MAG: helix-turn-helix domain-containing protein [Deltaproteobacteria bacterium]|nr:helix-turn-helix domain-containing protein [Deltaproteobacteria bacterium]
MAGESDDKTAPPDATPPAGSEPADTAAEPPQPVTAPAAETAVPPPEVPPAALPEEPEPPPPPPPTPTYLERIRAMTYYEILDIRRDASFDTINQAYKTAMQMFSPQSIAIYSILSSDEAATMASQVETAFRVLRDPIERRKYDKDLERSGLGAAEPGPRHATEGDSRGGGTPTTADLLLPEQKSFAFAASAFIIEALDSKPPRPVEVRAEAPPDAPEQPPPAAAAPAEPPREAGAQAAQQTVPAEVRATPVPADDIEEIEQRARQEAASPVRPISDTDSVPTLLPAPAVDLNAPDASPPPAAQSSDEMRGSAEAPDAALAPPEGDESKLGPGTTYTGPLLKKLRERAGLDLHDIAAITRITNTNLANIEEETYKDLPALVYVRGYIVQYAKCLKIPDPAGVAASYIERWKNAVGEIE